MNKIEVFAAFLAIYTTDSWFLAPDNDSPFSLYGLQNKALPQNLFQYPATCCQKVFSLGKFVPVIE